MTDSLNCLQTNLKHSLTLQSQQQENQADRPQNTSEIPQTQSQIPTSPSQINITSKIKELYTTHYKLSDYSSPMTSSDTITQLHLNTLHSSSDTLSAPNNPISHPENHTEKSLEKQTQIPSSNLIKGIQRLAASWNMIAHQYLLDSMDQIKQRQCLLLKCQIFAKTVHFFMKRKNKETFKQIYSELVHQSTLPQSSNSFTIDQVKQSVQTSLGQQSVLSSMRYERPKILCQNCRKQVDFRITISKSVQISNNSNSYQYSLKEPQQLQSGAFQEAKEAPKKIINLLPDEIFSSVNDQSIQFINIQIPLFLELNSRIQSRMSEPQSGIFDPQSRSLKEVRIPKETQPLLSLQQFQPVESISEVQVFPNRQPSKDIQFPPKQPSIQNIPNIQKSFIDRLLLQQSKYCASVSNDSNNFSPASPGIPLNLPRVQESQIIYTSLDNKDLFMKSIDMNQQKNVVKNFRVVNSPIKLDRLKSKFSDSQIKRHITYYRSKSRPSEHDIVSGKRVQFEQTVGTLREQKEEERKPTFFETAYYFS